MKYCLYRAHHEISDLAFKSYGSRALELDLKLQRNTDPTFWHSLQP